MERMLEGIERDKNRKLAAVIIEIIERVMKKLKNLEESEIIMKVMKKLYEELGIEGISRRIEFNELAKYLNINLRIESKKLFLLLQNILVMEKISK